MGKGLIVASIIAALFCLAPQAYAGRRPVLIKLATLAPEGTVFYEALLHLAQQWEQLSDGTVKLRIYPGGVSGNEYDMVRKLRIGQIQAAVLSSIGTMLIDPSYTVLQVPGMIPSYEQLDYCRKKLEPVFEKRFSAKGYKILNYGDAGHIYFFVDENVSDIKKLQQKKICTFTGDRASKTIWTQAGFKTVDISMNELLTSLQTGLADGFISSPILALSYQLFGKAGYMIDVSYGIAVACTIVRKDIWESIDAGLRLKLEQAADRVAEKFQGRIRALDQESIRIMTEHGLQVIRVSPDSKSAWLRPLKDMYPKIRGSVIPEAVFDRTLELKRQYRTAKQTAELSGASPVTE
jgi:TRAP-type C4-dicarboxylate transport system substrate-binding protein